MTDIATLGIQIDSRPVKTAVDDLDRLSGASSKTEKSVNSMSERTERSMQRMQRAFGGFVALLSVGQITRYADTFTSLQNRLRLVTDETTSLTLRTNQLFDVAIKTRGGFENTVILYSRLAESTKSLGVSQERLLKVVESVNKAVALSGSDTAASTAGLRQLAQGIQSGVLRGDELVSVLEGLPRVASAIAEGMGVATGQLRQLGADGKISALDVIQAFEKAEEQLNKEFAQVIPTVSGVLGNLSDAFLKFVGEINQSSGVTSVFVNTISLLVDNFQIAGRAALTAGLIIGTKFAAGGLMLAVGAMKALSLAITANPIGAIAKGVLIAVTALVAFSDNISLGTENLATLADFGRAAFSEISDAIKSFISFAGAAFSPLLESARTVFPGVSASFKSISNSAAKVIDGIVGLFKGLGNAIPIAIANLPQAIELIFNKVFNSVLESSATFTNLIIDNINKVSNFIGLPLIDSVNAIKIPLTKSGQSIGRAINKAIADGINKQDAAQKALDRIVKKADEIAKTRKAFNQAGQGAENFASKISELEQASSKASKATNKLTEEQKRLRDLFRRGQSVTRSVMTDLERYAETQKELNELLGAGAITQETYNRALKKAQEELDKFGRANEKTTSVIEQSWEQAGRNIQSAFAEYLFDPFDKGLKGMLKGFVNTIRRMVANIAASGLLKFGAGLIGLGPSVTLAESFGLSQQKSSSSFGVIDGLSTASTLKTLYGVGTEGFSSYLASNAAVLSDAAASIGFTTGSELLSGFSAATAGASSTGVAASSAAIFGNAGGAGTAFIGGPGTALGGTGLSAAGTFGSTLGSTISSIGTGISSALTSLSASVSSAASAVATGLGFGSAGAAGAAAGASAGAAAGASAGASAGAAGGAAAGGAAASTALTATGYGALVAAAIVGVSEINKAIYNDKTIGGVSGDDITKFGTGYLSEIPVLGDFLPKLGHVHTALFGRGPYKQKETNIRGDASLQGLENGVSDTKFKSQGGVFVSDRVKRVLLDVETGELEFGSTLKFPQFSEKVAPVIVEFGKAFDESIKGVATRVNEAGEKLGLGNLEGFSTPVNLASEKGKFFSPEEIAEELERLEEVFVRQIIPGVDDFIGEGETAIDVFKRITAQFESLTLAGNNLGLSTNDLHDYIASLSLDSRSAFIESAGGIEVLLEKTSAFSENYLTQAERLIPISENIKDRMEELGLVGVTTKEQFKDIVQSIIQTDGAGSELVLTLLDLQGQFAAAAEFNEYLDRQFKSLTSGLETLGHSASDANQEISSLDIKDQSSLVDAFGGLDAFENKIRFYSDTFLSESEKIEISARSVNSVLSEFGHTTDSLSKKGFGDLIKSFVLMGEEGAESANKLFDVAAGFLTIDKFAEDSAEKARKQAKENRRIAEENAAIRLLQLQKEESVLVSLGVALGHAGDQVKSLLETVEESRKSKFVADAGGVDVLGGNVSFFSANFLSEQERLAESRRIASEELGKLGLSIDITKDQFKELVQSFGQVDGITEQTLISLFSIQRAFIDLKKSAELASDKSAESARLQITVLENLGNTTAQAKSIIESFSAAEIENFNQAAGGINNLARASSALSGVLFTDEQRADQQSNRFREALDSAGFSQIDTFDQIKSALTGLGKESNFSGLELIKLGEIVLEFAPVITRMRDDAIKAHQDVEQAIKTPDEIKRDLRKQAGSDFNVLTRAVDAERNRLTDDYNKQLSITRARIESVSDSVDKLSRLSDLLDNAIESAVPQSFNAAKNNIKAALGNAMRGIFPDADDIRQSVNVLSNQSTAGFATREDFLRSQSESINLLTKLGDLTSSEQTLQERSLAALEASQSRLESGFAAEMQRLDTIVDNAQLQLDKLDGINTSILSIPEALSGFINSVNAANSVGSGGGASPALGVVNAADDVPSAVIPTFGQSKNTDFISSGTRYASGRFVHADFKERVITVRDEDGKVELQKVFKELTNMAAELAQIKNASRETSERLTRVTQGGTALRTQSA